MGDASQCPPLITGDTLDATHLSGSLGPNGTVVLHTETRVSDIAAPQGGPASGMNAAIDESDDSSVEDYGGLEPDPGALVADSRKNTTHDGRPPGSANEVDVDRPAGQIVPRPDGRRANRNSIPIRLSRTDKKGRYVLTADDPEIQAALRRGMERERAGTDAAAQKKQRTRMRDLVFTRQFTTFDRQNPSTSDSPFFGFFTLFWLAMVLIFVQVSMHNYRSYGSILGTNQIMKMMFSRDVLVLGLTDGVMFVATAVTFGFQRVVVQRGYLRWDRGGWILQNVWQGTYLGLVVGWTYFREWPWTHQIFTVLHGLVFLMKQHSYAFYNGYLSRVYRRRAALERTLKQLEHLQPVVSPPSSPGWSSVPPAERATGFDRHHSNSASLRRPSMGPRTGTNFTAEKSDVATVASAIIKGTAITTDQIATFSNIIHAEMDDLDHELQGKARSGRDAYPHNLTLANFAEYMCLPTLVYELEYPRQETTNWWYVLEKTTATFGVLCVMMVISQAFIYPPVARTVAMKEAGLSIEQRWREFPFVVSDMLFPLLIEQLLTWYLIWECILNVLAELTRFA